MPPTANKPEDEDYDSAADSDFGGSLSPSSGDESSGDEGHRKNSRKRDIEDSGDEGVIKEGNKKRRKKTKKAEGVLDEGLDESAIGMRVRERKLGRATEREKKPLASTEAATADVDALWARLNGAPQKPSTSVQTNGRAEQGDNEPQVTKLPDSATRASQNDRPDSSASTEPLGTLNSEETITIKRSYVFAGENITEEKVVPKSSAEARLYLESQATGSNSATLQGTKPPLRRPKKRPSIFEPNPEGIVKGLPSGTSKGPKLNTIEKSKLDWASHVDKEGLKDELDMAGKAKGGYMDRMDFLGRSEAKREEEMKNARRT